MIKFDYWDTITTNDYTPFKRNNKLHYDVDALLYRLCFYFNSTFDSDME